jgi:hypothetical protein
MAVAREQELGHSRTVSGDRVLHHLDSTSASIAERSRVALFA